MPFTQSKLNNALERCRILLRMSQLIPPETYVNITTFFNKICSLEKITNILTPISIEPTDDKRGIMFEWIKINPDKTIDTLDVTFQKKPIIKLKANYESLDIDIENEIELNDEFHEHAIVHLRHFKSKRKR